MFISWMKFPEKMSTGNGLVPDKVAYVPRFESIRPFTLDFNWGPHTKDLGVAFLTFLYLDFIGSSITFVSLGEMMGGCRRGVPEELINKNVIFLFGCALVRGCDLHGVIAPVAPVQCQYSRPLPMGRNDLVNDLKHDADKGQLGASIQFDLVPKGHGKASVPGRGRLCDQPVTRYYDTGERLNDHRGVDRGHKPDAVELLRRRHAEAHPVRLDSSGAGPSDLRHCYMCETRDGGQWYYWPPKRGANPGQPPHHRVCKTCQGSLHTENLDKEQHRASRCGVEYGCPDGACGPDGC
jgi:hypothetical protein